MSETNTTGPFHISCEAEMHAGIEYRGVEEIRALQERLLREHVAYAAGHSPYYRALLAREGLDAGAFHTLEDLRRIPCTRKEDLEAHNQEFLAAVPAAIVDVCLTSASTQETPTYLLQTASDLARLAFNESGAYAMMGAAPGETVYICAALDRCFMAGLAYFLGGVKRGLRMVRGGSGSAAQHWHALKLTGAAALIGVPSLMRKIAQFGLENGEDPARLGVKKLFAIGEPVRDGRLAMLPASRSLEQMWGAKLYSTYASTELATTFAECEERRGGHLRPELVVAEILDDAGARMPAGEAGEVVVTPLGVTGMPLLRFRTGDIAFMLEEPCPCGRNTPRLGPILGRKNQMLKYKGTTLFPSMILAILEGHAGVHGGYVEAHRNADGTDRVVVCVAARDASLGAEPLAEELRAHLRVVPELVMISADALEHKVNGAGKRKRTIFFDLRNRVDGVDEVDQVDQRH